MAEETGAPEPSLRDLISQSVEAVETASAAPAAPAAEAPLAEPSRSRDESGRFARAEPAATAPVAAPVLTTSPVAEPAAVAPVRPSSWKKEMWEGYDAIAKTNPAIAEYILQREREFQGGVSAYKTEAEQARGLTEAMAPYVPNLQKFGIEPARAVSNLLAAHERLSLGSQQEKIALGAKILRDYQIDVPALMAHLQNPQAQQPAPQQQPQYSPQQITQTVQQAVQQELLGRDVETAYQSFINEKDEQGAPKHPHFETVKDTMAGLLQTNQARDYKDAYNKALRLHDDLYEADIQRRVQSAEQERLAASKAQVARARGNAVSPRSATPTMTNGSGKPANSLRGTIEDAFDEAPRV